LEEEEKQYHYYQLTTWSFNSLRFVWLVSALAAAVAHTGQSSDEVRKTASFFEFFLCLPRACLGRMIVFDIWIAQTWRVSQVSDRATVKKRSFWAIYVSKCSFYQDRLGTNIGKALQKTGWRFLAGLRSEGEMAERIGEGAENAIFEQFLYKNDHFAKTGLGQT
jgi:hypothetical protein